MTEPVVNAKAAPARTTYRILVANSSYCKSCGICIELCPKQSLILDPDTRKVVLDKPETCNGCGLCEFLCPDFVLMLVDDE